MSQAATQIASQQFDKDFFRLPPEIRAQIQQKIDFMGARLAAFAHFRMTNSDKCRLRVGDYRVIYRYDVPRGEIYLIAVGHRSEIYRA